MAAIAEAGESESGSGSESGEMNGDTDADRDMLMAWGTNSASAGANRFTQNTNAKDSVVLLQPFSRKTRSTTHTGTLVQRVYAKSHGRGKPKKLPQRVMPGNGDNGNEQSPGKITVIKRDGVNVGGANGVEQPRPKVQAKRSKGRKGRGRSGLHRLRF